MAYGRIAPMATDGFLNLLKPPGMTSHDVVSSVRERLGLGRVGHLGTLDPAAAGVLPLAVGRATRLYRFAAAGDKAYRAEISFGVATDTMDAEGAVTASGDASQITRAKVEEALSALVGETQQSPPAFSAVRVGGRRSHELAREGSALKRPPRSVRVSQASVVAVWPGSEARALVDIVCGPGTYIRVLASDLGRALGCCAYLSFLVRTRVGRFKLTDALTLEECRGSDRQGGPAAHVLPLDWPLAHLPGVALDDAAARVFLHGGQVSVAAPQQPLARVYAPCGRLLGIGEVREGRELRPRVVVATREGPAR